MKAIKTVGVIGAGTMGSALAQKFAQEGFNVILADREMKFVEKGLGNIEEILNQGVERKIFTKENVENILSRITGVEKLEILASCEFIIEAIFEDLNAKKDLFKNLCQLVDANTILATNTSSFSVNELSKSVTYPERFIGMHYFFHAAKNRLVEIIPGEKTSKEVYEMMKMFSVKSGKDAITTKDSYGFAINRFFVPWLNEAVRILEDNVADTGTIDFVCKRLFGIGMGPFALMNATGVPIAYHAQKTLEVFGNYYKTTELLSKQAESKQEWEINDIDSNLLVAKEIEKEIRNRMLGCVFFVCSQILEEKVCSATELNRGSRIGLKWRKGPIDLMNKYGEEEVIRLVKLLTDKYSEKIPSSIMKENWFIDYVEMEIKNKIAVIKIARPEDMNALNEKIMSQLYNKFKEAEENKNIDTIIIHGLGKAFVAGADIKFFVQNIKNNSISKIENFTKFGQKVFKEIDESTKTIVAIINGLALGGGLELALCADIIWALPNALLAYPETGIGIYPGLGGTQRTAEKIGKGLSKYLIYTGKMINAENALQIGLVNDIISLDKFFDYTEGKEKIPEKTKSLIELNEKWLSTQDFFNINNIINIINGNVKFGSLAEDEAIKLNKTIEQKAPLALKTAEQLIDAAEGCESELKKLNYIFSTNDALLGLSSIGKKVEFTGT